MFTGLVTAVGSVVSLSKSAKTARLKLSAPLADVALGDSIAINGVCLTVSSFEGSGFVFDISDATLKHTNLGGLKTGDIVNLEPALRASGKLGGHFVTGHVDAVGKIRKIAREGELIKIEISVPADIMQYFVEKGSVALDGISLTVSDVLPDAFTIVIIPHTQKETTIGHKKQGDGVNIETDIIGKYVYRYLNRGAVAKEDSLMKKLMEEGFAG